MARTLSTTALASIHAESTSEVWLVLLTLSHASLAAPIRVVNNTEDITSRGNLFTAFPFEIVLPGEQNDGPISASVRFDNVSREILYAVRGLTSSPSISLEVILASDPNTVELSFDGLLLRNVNYSSGAIEGDLQFEMLYQEPITLTMTPSRFPGLF